MNANNKDNYFEPIVQMSMTEIVEERIREYLKKKKLKPGDSIPKETELAEQLQVSRNVIREALSRFRMLGLIETRKKRGMILTKPDIFNGLERVLDPILLGDKTLIDIFEMRLVLELGLAELLFINKTDEDIKELEAILINKKNESTSIFKVEQEVEFHGKLYKITKNETLLRFQKLLLPIFQYVIDIESHFNHPPDIGKVNHQQLIEILKKGDSVTFRQGMYEHLKPHYEWISNFKKNHINTCASI